MGDVGPYFPKTGLKNFDLDKIPAIVCFQLYRKGDIGKLHKVIVVDLGLISPGMDNKAETWIILLFLVHPYIKPQIVDIILHFVYRIAGHIGGFIDFPIGIFK